MVSFLQVQRACDPSGILKSESYQISERDHIKDAGGTSLNVAARIAFQVKCTALKPLLSVRDLARTLGVSVRTVETLIAQGRLRPLWIKGQRRFHPDAVDAYLRACEKAPRRPRHRSTS